jgi:VanZ family protein
VDDPRELPFRGKPLEGRSSFAVLLPESPLSGRHRLPGDAPVIQYGFTEETGAVCRGGADSRYDLVVPSVFQAPKKGILFPPWRVQKFDRSFWKDMFVNILGFIPFGFAVYAWAHKSGERKGVVAMGIALLLGAGISLFIELLQVYLPTRDSSLTDVMNNVLGTYIGARLFQATRDILYR